RGLNALRALREARGTMNSLRGVGSVHRAAERGVDSALGQVSGLPLDADGPKSLGSQVRHTISDEMSRWGASR
ncbi:hypothetical protein KGQ20_45980, partial [Catenulispora sp. NF23]